MQRLFIIMAVFLFCAAAWAGNQFKVITLQHRFGEDLLPALQPLVGPEGAISASGSNLFVDVAPERLAAIEQAIAAMDVERRMYRIRIERTGESQATSREVDVYGSLGNEVRIERARPGRQQNGVTIEMDRRETMTQKRGGEFLTVLDGASAFIAVGQSVPFTEYWATLVRRHAPIEHRVHYRDITTGFSVLPRQVGNEVELQITPRISSLGRGDVIDFQSLTSTVRVKPGTWLELGGSLQVNDEVSRAILAWQDGRNARNHRLRVLVESQ